MTIFVTKHFEPPEIVCAEKSFLVQIREGLNFAQFLPRIYTFVFVICYKKFYIFTFVRGKYHFLGLCHVPIYNSFVCLYETTSLE